MYATIAKLRGLLYEFNIFKPSEFDLPIINIGNLAVGGSGKTPHIEYLINLLSKEYNVATLSRGYGRNSKGFREVLTNSTAAESGDEPLQIKLKFPDIHVYVGEDRVEAITKLIFKQPETDIILLDDAYQHRPIKAGFNILLTDYKKIFTRDKSMPFGRLREYPNAASRSQMVVVSKCPKAVNYDIKKEYSEEINKFTNSPVLFSTINYKPLFAFNKGMEIPKLIENILVISGLAKPENMLTYIGDKYRGAKIEHLEYRDHYKFSKKDIDVFIEKFNIFAGSNKLIIISEKDAARLREVSQNTVFEKLEVFVLPIAIDFIDGNSNFNDKILDYVRKNSRNYSIS